MKRNCQWRKLAGTATAIISFQLFVSATSLAQSAAPLSTIVNIKGELAGRVYIITDVSSPLDMIVRITDSENREVTRETVSMTRSGRTATQIHWKKLSPQGLIPPGEYTLAIDAEQATKKVLIKSYGLAIGHFTSGDAANALDIQKVIPDPVEKEAKIVYLLGQRSFVTLNILDSHGVCVDTIIKDQDRGQGQRTEDWVRKDKITSGNYIVQGSARGITSTALDVEKFRCK
jgi:hypothetical protein